MLRVRPLPAASSHSFAVPCWLAKHSRLSVPKKIGYLTLNPLRMSVSSIASSDISHSTSFYQIRSCHDWTNAFLHHKEEGASRKKKLKERSKLIPDKHAFKKDENHSTDKKEKHHSKMKTNKYVGEPTTQKARTHTEAISKVHEKGSLTTEANPAVNLSARKSTPQEHSKTTNSKLITPLSSVKESQNYAKAKTKGHQKKKASSSVSTVTLSSVAKPIGKRSVDMVSEDEPTSKAPTKSSSQAHSTDASGRKEKSAMNPLTRKNNSQEPSKVTNSEAKASQTSANAKVKEQKKRAPCPGSIVKLSSVAKPMWKSSADMASVNIPAPKAHTKTSSGELAKAAFTKEEEPAVKLKTRKRNPQKHSKVAIIDVIASSSPIEELQSFANVKTKKEKKKASAPVLTAGSLSIGKTMGKSSANMASVDVTAPKAHTKNKSETHAKGSFTKEAKPAVNLSARKNNPQVENCKVIASPSSVKESQNSVKTNAKEKSVGTKKKASAPVSTLKSPSIAKPVRENSADIAKSQESSPCRFSPCSAICATGCKIAHFLRVYGLGGMLLYSFLHFGTSVALLIALLLGIDVIALFRSYDIPLTVATEPEGDMLTKIWFADALSNSFIPLYLASTVLLSPFYAPTLSRAVLNLFR
mmetsp:Transcript_8049/g.10734  ORF Transcript_8049/g.10734 Transcript_8049/m.10734 type:complete len:641 (-) Transcript_8049:369-2291(-)